MDASPILTKAFTLAEELEQTFSKFRPDSDLSRFNIAPAGSVIEIPEVFADVLILALDLFTVTKGGFTPYASQCGEVSVSRGPNGWLATKITESTLDLSGIAKGYAVDKICELIQGELPQCSGVVNAGGDLRFINVQERDVAVRGDRATSSLRKLRVERDGVATSNFSECRGNPFSSTTYPMPTGEHIDEACSVTVIASKCAVADALTKAVWFGSRDVIPICVKKYDAEVLILDGQGEVREQYA